MPITIVDFTVALPSYTSGSSLPEVLEQLHVQIATEENFCWKIVVVNNSAADSTDIVREYRTHWPQSCPLTSLLETEEAAALARYRAKELIKTPRIENLSNDDFVSTQEVGAFYEFSQEIDTWGNLILRRNLKIFPAQDFQRILCFLVIVEPGVTAYRYEHYQKRVFIRNRQEAPLTP